MHSFTHYNDLDEVFNYLFEILPESCADRIASVSKYAMVRNQKIIIKAIKNKLSTGFAWNFEVTIDH